MPTPIHNFTKAIQLLKWFDNNRDYYDAAENRLLSNDKTPANSLERGLCLYLYSNHGHTHAIRNKNKYPDRPLGVVVCPPGCYTLKSGKFEGGLHHHIRNDVHSHLWRPEAVPRQDHIAPQVMCWFLAFETDPGAPTPEGVAQKTRVGYYNALVRQWLSDLELNSPHQNNRMDHRWICSPQKTPPITVEKGRKFLESLLAANRDW